MADLINRKDLLKDIYKTVVVSTRTNDNNISPEIRGINKVINRIKAAFKVGIFEVWNDIQNDLPKLPKECEKNDT